MDAAPTSPRRGETSEERADRNLNELLGELRVALPGVQVLFAFLLIVPFNQRFPRLSAFEEKLYFGTLLCAAASSVLLIAPSVHHRLLFRLQEKEYLVTTANRLVIAGLAFLAVAMLGVITLITNLLFGTAATIVTTGLVAVLFGVFWYALPLRRRREVAGSAATVRGHERG